ncbi:hypothetical protein [Coleofasciculus chthonoplastes]|uniref:hypothetical protein n=1 Tax=Coleofasciculus chthonoplastes TaxID=64178 RepID=UPI003303114D
MANSQGTGVRVQGSRAAGNTARDRGAGEAGEAREAGEAEITFRAYPSSIGAHRNQE